MLAVLSQPPPSGWDVVLLAPPNGPLPAAARELGVEVVDWSIREDGHKPPPEWAVVSLREAADRVGADLLHANSLSLARLTGRLAREDDRPATGHLRDMMRLSGAARRDLSANRRLIAVSPAVQAYHEAEGVTGITVVPNGIAPIERKRPPGWLRAELGLPSDVPLIATVGQIGLRKGHDVASAALRFLMRSSDGRLPSFVWLVVGERFSQKAESVAYEEQLGVGLGDAIRRLGWRDDVPELLAECTMLLHPARQEPFGRVLLEAREVGLPIVACDVGGNRFAAPGATLVPVDDAAAMAAAISEMLATPASTVDTPASLAFPVSRCSEETWAIWQHSVTAK